MKQSPPPRQGFSQADRTKLILVSIFLAILLLVLGLLIGLLLRQSGFGLSMLAERSRATPTLAPAGALPTTSFVPTIDCGSPTLVLGTTTFQIESLSPAPDGSLTVPPESLGIAYWVEGTNVNHVFLLNSAPSNLSLATSLKSGDKAEFLGPDCGIEDYEVLAIEAKLQDHSTLFDQSVAGITVVVQADSTTPGFVVRCGRPQLLVTEPPQAIDVSPIEAEISLLGVSTSSDRSTITVDISILNTDTKSFSLTTDYVSLTPENAASLTPVQVDPPLPRELQPDVKETFSVTFPRPSTSTAVLKVLQIEIDLEGY